MRLELVAGQANGLDATLLEVGLQLGNLTQLGRADGSEVTRSRSSALSGKQCKTARLYVRWSLRRVLDRRSIISGLVRCEQSACQLTENKMAHESPIHSWKEIGPC